MPHARCARHEPLCCRRVMRRTREEQACQAARGECGRWQACWACDECFACNPCSLEPEEAWTGEMVLRLHELQEAQSA